MQADLDRAYVYKGKIYRPGAQEIPDELGDLLNLVKSRPPDGPHPGSALINLNTATESELEQLTDVGPASARKIASRRPYADFAEFYALNEDLSVHPETLEVEAVIGD